MTVKRFTIALSAVMVGAALSAVGVVGTDSTAAAASRVCDRSAMFPFVASDGTYFEGRVPTYSTAGYVDCILGTGATGSAVQTLQTTLNRCYQQGLAVDGQFGSATRAALVKVQGRIGVRADGIYGSQTRTALKWHAVNRAGQAGCLRLS